MLALSSLAVALTRSSSQPPSLHPHSLPHAAAAHVEHPAAANATEHVDAAKLERWRALASKSRAELQVMGGASNVTLLASADATRRTSREVLPERATHVIDGEGEDPGGQHEAKSTTPRPRGREWRAALAKRINLERRDQWRKGEAAWKERSKAVKLPAPSGGGGRTL